MSFFESIFYMAWRGVAIGLIISAPMGPVGMLCIQRTLDKGRKAGFYTGLGAAISDLFYSLLTGFGLSFIEEFLERNSNIIQLIGSGVLIAFGVYLFRKNPAHNLKKAVKEEVSIKKNILGGFLFTFSNPLILFLIIGLFARFNFLLPEHHIGQYFTGFLFLFIGALVWWWFITFTIDKVRNHFNIRSMWLINKIIGVIILLFAVVGIVTATSALASAQELRCWNEKRGFETFSPDWALRQGDAPGRIDNTTADTLRLLTPAGELEYMEFQFKAFNHHNHPGKTYSYTAPDGTKAKTRHPGWGIVVKSTSGDEVSIGMGAGETPSDGVSSAAAMIISSRFNGIPSSERSHSDRAGALDKIKGGKKGVDSSGGSNFFKVLVNPRTLSLLGGIHSPEPLLQLSLPEGFMVDSVGYFLAPAASVTFAEMRLGGLGNNEAEFPWDDIGLLEAYLDNSRDRMEGYWQVLDRSLDEDLLRLGGDYRLAIVRDADGYAILYLSGAKINASAWQPGMLKGRLSRSGIDGIWNVTWIDAMHQPLSHELKAQTDANGSLAIQFPYQASSLRLHQSSGNE